MMLDKTLETLSLTMSSGDMIIPSVQIGLLGAITAILQYLRLDAHKSKSKVKLSLIKFTVCYFN